jgi:N-acetyl-anhydromuramyl-L-alanine amidase AmpD
MSYPFIRARHFTPASRGKADIDVIVLHTMEFPETPDAAERVAHYFQTTSREVSAHYNVDNNSVVQCVREDDVAYAAPGNNWNGIQIEQSGFARQTAAGWNDAYSKALLERTARLIAEITKRYAIPIVPLDAADLRADRRGVTTHVAVSRAWGRSDHTDPGRAFPLGKVLARAKELRGSGPPRPKPRPKPRPTLREGDRGFQVKRAQRLLNEKPGIQIAADGIFGPETKAAVVKFQRRRGLAGTGVIGPKTWAALLKRPRATGSSAGGAVSPGLFELSEALPGAGSEA